MPYRMIKATKTIVDAGSWQTGKVPSKAFPTHKPIPLPANSRWRCLWLACGSADLRLLIVVQTQKNAFHAWLGEVSAGKLYVLAALEDHATHPGLHCHAPCEARLPSYTGSVRYPTMAVAPRGDSHRRRMNRWTETKAWQEALKFYRVSDRPEGSLL